MAPLRICLVASEFAPFAKTGGLADVTAGLSDYLHRSGHDVRAFLPLYPRVHSAGHRLAPVDGSQDVPLKVGPWHATFSLFRAELPDSGQAVYFVDCPHLYRRPSLYTDDPDEHLRFLFLARAVLESCQRLQWGPHILHANDWQAGFLPLYLKTLYAWDALFKGTKSVLTIHNIGYQGRFPATFLPDTDLGDSSYLLHQDDLRAGVINSLKTGVLYADAMTTVSATYAREIQTEAYGLGLEGLLREASGRLLGIVNGADYRQWNPETDPLIAAPYSRADPSGKGVNKVALCDAMGIKPVAGLPVAGIVSRLVGQKGFELCYEALPALLRARRMGLTVLGAGEPRYVEFFRGLQRAFPGRVSYYEGYSEKLAHLIEAGADIFLMPSLYEPCGLNQIYSLRYGTLPVVRRTGGLADTVEHVQAGARTGTGFLFDHFTSDGFRWALEQALRAYRDQTLWRQIMANAMAQDFSWEVQGKHYLELYRRLAGLEE